jgi:predicted AAA+ superfamily ATPase
LEQTILALKPNEAYFWATHGGAEMDLFFLNKGKRFGIEFKFSEAPRITRGMHTALADLELDHLWVIYPGENAYPVHERITVWPLIDVYKLTEFT